MNNEEIKDVKPVSTPSVENTQEAKKLKSFSKFGDKGSTQVAVNDDGTPDMRSKSSTIVKIWGEIDETSAFLGKCQGNGFRDLQHFLYEINAMLFNKQVDSDKIRKRIGKMERFCEKYEYLLDDKFKILTGDVNLARVWARRVERRLWTQIESTNDNSLKVIAQFFNRMSSYLFMECIKRQDYYTLYEEDDEE